MMTQTTEEILAELDKQRQMVSSKIIKDVLRDHDKHRAQALDLWARFKIRKATSSEHGPGVRILARESHSEADPNHRLNHAYERKIAKNKRGYMRGVTITTEADAEKESLEAWLRVERIPRLLGQTLNRATVTGRAFWLLWVEEGEVRVRLSESWETTIIYDESGDPLYAFRYWDIKDQIKQKNRNRRHVEVYDRQQFYAFTENDQGDYVLDDEPTPHFFPTVPVVEFRNDDEAIGHIAPVTRLIDAIDIAVSDLSSEVTAVRLAYLVQEIVDNFQAQDIDDEFLETMKRTGILQGNWSFLEKDLKVDAVKELIQHLHHAIYEFADSYDPNELAEGDPTAFQIAQKLKPLEDAATETEELFREAIYDVLKLVSGIWSGSNRMLTVDSIVQTYPRNVPRNRKTEIETIIAGGGRVSNRTLLEGSAIIDDVERELERLAEEDAMAPPSVFDEEDPDNTGLQAGTDIQRQALNGAQIKSLIDIASQVALRQLPEDTAVEILLVSIPSLTEEAAREIISPAASFQSRSVNGQ